MIPSTKGLRLNVPTHKGTKYKKMWKTYAEYVKEDKLKKMNSKLLAPVGAQPYKLMRPGKPFTIKGAIKL